MMVVAAPAGPAVQVFRVRVVSVSMMERVRLTAQGKSVDQMDAEALVVRAHRLRPARNQLDSVSIPHVNRIVSVKTADQMVAAISVGSAQTAGRAPAITSVMTGQSAYRMPWMLVKRWMPLMAQMPLMPQTVLPAVAQVAMEHPSNVLLAQCLSITASVWKTRRPTWVAEITWVVQVGLGVLYRTLVQAMRHLFW